MDEGTEEKIKQIWRQNSVPVIYRQGGSKPLMIHLPYAKGNKDWIEEGHRNKPAWNQKYKCWQTPKAWFNDLITRSLSRYGRVYVIQPYREQEKCAPACWNAVGHECQCSCMGENHGSQGPNGKWLVVSDAFATRWHEKKLACRLMTKNGGQDVLLNGREHR